MYQKHRTVLHECQFEIAINVSYAFLTVWDRKHVTWQTLKPQNKAQEQDVNVDKLFCFSGIPTLSLTTV